MGEMIAELPPTFHIQEVMAYIRQKYNLPTVFYMDLWPFSAPMMIIGDPAAAAQMTSVKSLPKHPVNHAFVEPLVGKSSIVLVEGAQWKQIRNIVMPSFAPSYLSTFTPVFAKHTKRFLARLDALADSGERSAIQPLAMALTFDTICEVIMGTDHDSQRTNDALNYHYGMAAKYAGAMTNSVQWVFTAIPRWWHASRQDKIVTKIIKDRYVQTRSSEKGSRMALDAFIQAHREQHPSATELDPAYLSMVLCNIKSLLLGGHDTTSSTLSYVLGMLATQPAALTRLRAEHASVFNTKSFDSIAEQINAKPSLLSDAYLPYTAACIKETMRIFAPASTGRVPLPGSQSITYKDAIGNAQTLPLLPNHHLWIVHIILHNNKDLFPSPHEFLPERFLPDESPFPPINKDAYRPFERGPRACVGSELAMMELKLVLIAVFTASNLEIQVDYPNDAPRAPEGSGLGGPDGRWWQVIEFAAKPTQGMPMRLRRRKE